MPFPREQACLDALRIGVRPIGHAVRRIHSLCSLLYDPQPCLLAGSEFWLAMAEGSVGFRPCSSSERSSARSTSLINPCAPKRPLISSPVPARGG